MSHYGNFFRAHRPFFSQSPKDPPTRMDNVGVVAFLLLKFHPETKILSKSNYVKIGLKDSQW